MCEDVNYFINKGAESSIDVRFEEELILLNNIKVLCNMKEPIDVNQYATYFLCKKGSLSATINMNKVVLNSGNIMVIMPGDKIQLMDASDDLIGNAVAIDRKYINNLNITAEQSMTLFMQFKKNPIIKMDKNAMDLLGHHYGLIKKVILMEESHYRSEIIQSLLRAFCLMDLDYIYNSHFINTNQRMHEIFDKFYNLVRSYYKESREVIFYADKLCITPKYLSATVKNCTGRSAHDWIHDYVLAEAKRLLKTTNLSVVEISDQLGFPNQSFFGKFFKQHTGITPYKFKLN